MILEFEIVMIPENSHSEHILTAIHFAIEREFPGIV